MASRDSDDILRDLRRSGTFVLVQRRSRKPRGRQVRDRKLVRSTPGAADTWLEKGSPGAERSTAKGKRLSNSGRCGQDSDHSRNSGVCPADHHIHRSGQPSPVCPCSTHPQSRSSTSGLCVFSEVNEEQAVQPSPWSDHVEDGVCATEVSGPRHHRFFPNQPVLTSPLCSQGCAPSLGGCRVHTCQEITSAGWCYGLPHNHGEVRYKAAHRQNEFHERNCSSFDGHGLDSDIARASTQTSSKLLWLDWRQSKTCLVPNVVSSRVCICSHCCPKDQVIGDSENVCDESNACVRTTLFSQRSAFPPREEFMCVFQRKHHLRDHHVIVNLASDGSDSPGSKEKDNTCRHTCPVCPCQRCQQQRQTSLTRSALRQQDQALASRTNSEHKACPSHLSDNFAYCHSDPELSGAQQSSCSQTKSDWTRMVRMRYVGRCLLLLVLIGFGGLLAHVTVTDVSSGNNAGVDGAIGAGVLLGGGYQVDVLMKIQMRPVPVKEFQARLRTVRNKFDLLRIFLADKDISDESLMKLLTASLLSSSSHALVSSDVRNIAVTSPMEDVDTVSRSDLNIEVARDVRTDSNLPKGEGLSNPTESETQNVTRKDNESADSVMIQEKPGKETDPSVTIKEKPGRDTEDHVSLSRQEKSGRDLPKRDITLSKQKNSKRDFQHIAVRAMTSSTTVASKASPDEPVNTAAEGSFVRQESRVKPDDREETSPSSFQVNDVTNDIREDTSPSSFKVSDVESGVREDISPSPSSFEVSDVKSDAREHTTPSSFKVSDVESDVRGNTPSSNLEASDVRSDVKEDTIPPSVSSDVNSGVTEVTPPSNFKVFDVKIDVREDTPPAKLSNVKQDTGFDDVQLAEVQKRAEPLYDDDDYPEDEDIKEEDYLDGEMDYYNDEAHADAILEELEEAVHHIAEMEDNPQARCKDPLPQVVYIEDPKKQNRQFYPECTVIHRCRNDSGCCGRNYECGPKYEQVIFRTFLAVTLNTTSLTVLPDSRMVERIALVNHTECECREKPRLPDCTQACPGVFRMYRYGSQCVCDCKTSANERFPQCDNVKDGLSPLSHDDLVCIKSGKCGLPRCSKGQFDVSLGFCPLTDLYSIPSPLLRDRLRRQYEQRHQRSRHHGPASSVPVEGSGDF